MYAVTPITLFFQVYLALIGVFGIGLSSLVSYGLASAVGMAYGPIHPMLPFLLLGKFASCYTGTVGGGLVPYINYFSCNDE